MTPSHWIPQVLALLRENGNQGDQFDLYEIVKVFHPAGNDSVEDTPVVKLANATVIQILFTYWSEGQYEMVNSVFDRLRGKHGAGLTRGNDPRYAFLIRMLRNGSTGVMTSIKVPVPYNCDFC